MKFTDLITELRDMAYRPVKLPTAIEIRAIHADLWNQTFKGEDREWAGFFTLNKGRLQLRDTKGRFKKVDTGGQDL